jgi:hypothetical protein
MKKEIILLTALFFSLAFFQLVQAQTMEFSFQGSLQNNGAAATGNHDFEFLLFDAIAGGTQIGATLTRNSVAVTNGIFSVNLDFGASFPGAIRFLEIRVRQAGGGALNTLTPRQSVKSAPYSVKSITATDAEQLGGISANQYVLTGDPRLTDGRIPLPDSANYIQNTNSPQAASNFNISGTGTANILNAATQYNIGGSRVLTVDGLSNVFAGVDAGGSNTSGNSNSFFGFSAGKANTTGAGHSFFGTRAGHANTTGNNNSFFGIFAGDSNTTGSLNSFFGSSAGESNTTGHDNSFFGPFAGSGNTAGTSNSFFGDTAGSANTTGNNNTIIGKSANVGSGDLTFATAMGAGSRVSASNTVVLGRSADAVQIPGALTVTGTLNANGSAITNVNASNILTGTLDVARLGNGVILNISNGTPQANSNFSISGTGTANIFTAALQYNIGGNRVLSVAGSNNVFVGVFSGTANTGSENSFFGRNAGQANTNGNANSFFGSSAGGSNTTGTGNSFYGRLAGQANTTGVTNSFFGGDAGLANTTGSDNSFFGGTAGQINTIGSFNSFFGRDAGSSNTSGLGNSFFGRTAGETNTTGINNSFFGVNADAGANNLTNASAIGSNSFVTQSNSLVLGSINGINGATADTNVGIGTTAPAKHLHVRGAGDQEIMIESSDVGGIKWTLQSSDGASGGRFEIVDRTGGVSRFTMVANGSVGIGIVAPVQKLDVAGNIRLGTGMAGCVQDRDGTVITGVCSSDLRFKRHITPFGSILNSFSKLRPVNFYWRGNEFADKHFGTKQSFGLIAQEVEPIFPDLVSTDEQGYRVVNYSKLPLMTIQAVKEQQAQIDSLAAEIKSQKAVISDQRTEIDALRAHICSQSPSAAFCKAKE